MDISTSNFSGVDTNDDGHQAETNGLHLIPF